MAAFEKEHYLGESTSQLDTIFFTAHLVMTAIHKRLLVTSREQRMFEAAVVLLAGTLLTKLFYREIYNKHRTAIVFLTHIVLTTLRALVCYSMSSKQAVHFRISLVAGNSDNPGAMLATMLSVLGGPFRAFEMLGLQQPFMLHAIVTIYYIVVHTAGAMTGCRLAYSNAMFYLVHEVHDGLAAVVDTVLDSLVAMPTSQQATCSSCAGAVVYTTLHLFGSVAAPLYVAYAVEQSARQRFHRRLAAASQGSAGQQNAQQQQPEAEEMNGLHLIGEASHRRQQEDDLQQQQQQQQMLEDPMLLVEAATAANAGSATTNCIARWAVHLLAMLLMLLLSWIVANAFALQLLPRVLSSQQLDLWCPNRPLTPYVIAGQVYDP